MTDDVTYCEADDGEGTTPCGEEAIATATATITLTNGRVFSFDVDVCGDHIAHPAGGFAKGRAAYAAHAVTAEETR